MRLVPVALLSAVVLFGAGGCAGDAATPIDLREPSGPTGTVDPVQAATPHPVGEHPQARFYAEQQCLDDPEQEQGVIRIVDPADDAVVGEVVVDCDDVRGDAAG